MRERSVLLTTVAATSALALLVLASPARAATLAGRVLSSDKRALAGAEAIAIVAPGAAAEAERTKRATAGEDGGFSIDVGDAPGPFHVVVRAAGRASIALADVKPEEALEAVLPPGATVTGRVVAAPGDEPLSGARVVLDSARSKDPAKPAGEGPKDASAVLVASLLRPAVVTDAKGGYRLDGRLPGAYALSVEAEGRRREVRQMRLDSGAAVVADFRLEPTIALEGVVRGPDGGPLAGADVVLNVFDSPRPVLDPADVPPTLRTTSASDGRYSVPGLVPGARYVARFERKGRATALREVHVPGARPENPPQLDVTLASPVRVTGTVVDEEGRPLAGVVPLLEAPGTEVEVPRSPERYSLAFVDLSRRSAPRSLKSYHEKPAPYPGSTAGDGRFAIEDAAPGTYAVRVLLDDSPRPTATTLVLEPGKPALDLVVTVVLGGALAGRLVDADGKAIAGARVSAQAEVDGKPSRTVLQGWTEAGGRFALRGVPEGTCGLLLSAKGYIGRRERVACRGPEQDWTLARSGAIAGRVTLEGGGVPPLIRVAAVVPAQNFGGSGIPVDIDEDGGYRLDVGEGTYEVVLSAPGFAVASVPDVVVTSGRTTAGVDAVLTRGASVSGVVVRRGDGAPLAGVAVWPERARLTDAETARSNLDGSFRVEGLAPGPVSLRATRAGYGAVRVADVEARADGAGKAVRIEMGPAGAIAGRVARADGSPEPAGTRISVSDPDRSRRADTFTDAAGRFRFDDLAAGTWELRLEGSRGVPRETRRVTAREGETTEVEIVSGGSSRLKGRVTRAGSPVAGAVVEVVTAGVGGHPSAHSATTDADGRFAIDGVAPGRASASVREGDASVLRNQRVTVPATGEVEQDFELPSRFLSGTVVDAAGAPAASVWIRAWKAVEGSRSEALGHVTSGPDGRFRMPLAAAGVIELRAQRSADGASATTRIEAGEGETEGLEIRLGEGGVIRLRVTDAAGRPLPAAEVATSLRGEEARGSGARVTPSGRYEWRGAKGAVVSFTVTVPGLAPAFREVTCPADDVHVVLNEGGALDVTVPAAATGSRPRLEWSLRDAAGASVGEALQWSGSQAVEDTHTRDGHVRFKGLAPGSYTFTLTHRDATAPGETPAIVAVGSTTEIVAVLPIFEPGKEPQPYRDPMAYGLRGKPPAGPHGTLLVKLDPMNAPPPPVQTQVVGPGGAVLWPVAPGVTPPFAEEAREGRARRFVGVAVGTYTVNATAQDGRTATTTVTVTDGGTAEAMLRFVP